MRFGVFYELQLLRPWAEGAEHRLFHDALAQIELADRLGIDSAWAVEHHFLEEYSYFEVPSRWWIPREPLPQNTTGTRCSSASCARSGSTP